MGVLEVCSGNPWYCDGNGNGNKNTQKVTHKMRKQIIRLFALFILSKGVEAPIDGSCSLIGQRVTSC